MAGMTPFQIKNTRFSWCFVDVRILAIEFAVGSSREKEYNVAVLVTIDDAIISCDIYASVVFVLS